MKLSLGPYTSVSFARLPEEESDPFREWHGSIRLQNEDVDLQFSERLFSQNPQSVWVNWEDVQWVFEKVLQEIEAFTQQSKKEVLALNQQIFGNEYVKHQGYFSLICIEITQLHRNRSIAEALTYEVEFIFSLDSKTDFLLDPYFLYTATFSGSDSGPFSFKNARRD